MADFRGPSSVGPSSPGGRFSRAGGVLQVLALKILGNQDPQYGRLCISGLMFIISRMSRVFAGLRKVVRI